MIGAASPNHGPRRGGAGIDIVVLHYTAMRDAAAAIARLCDPEFEVSAHWLVARDGGATPLVPEDRRAWHAGAGRWGDVCDVNSRSIGIELDNDGASPFPEAQVAATAELLHGMLARHPGIVPARVLAHSDVAPSRKVDPGALFPWRRLAERGLSVWPDRAGEGDLECSLTRIGYDPQAPLSDRLRAFRLRFRPEALAGPADAVDAGLAARVAELWPCAGAGAA